MSAINVFNRAAGRYDRVAELPCEVAERLLSRLDYINLTPQRILDLGCGTGFVAHCLHNQYRKSQIIALDQAESMLAVTNGKRGWFNRIRSSCATFQALPLAADSVDLILSNLALQWCDDWPIVIKELYRVLKPEGLLLFSSVGPDTLTELRESWAAVDKCEHVNSQLDMHDIGDILLHTGFSDPVMDMEILNMYYPDVKTILRDLKSHGSYCKTSEKYLTGKTKFNAMLQHYERYKQVAGYPVSIEAIYGHAWKPKPRPTSYADEQGVVSVSIDQIGRRKF